MGVKGLARFLQENCAHDVTHEALQVMLGLPRAPRPFPILPRLRAVRRAQPVSPAVKSLSLGQSTPSCLPARRTRPAARGHIADRRVGPGFLDPGDGRPGGKKRECRRQRRKGRSSGVSCGSTLRRVLDLALSLPT